jgi:hypothetical protein
MASASVFDDHEVREPRWNALKGAVAKEEVEALTKTATNQSKLRCKNVFFVPPLVTATILEANTTDPAALIPLLSKAFHLFDRSSEQTKACTILRPVLEFLWAVSEHKISPIILGRDSSHKSSNWINILQLSYITQPTNLQTHQLSDKPMTTASNTLLESLVGVLQKINNMSFQSTLNPFNSDNKRDSTGSWDKNPEIQLMILKLSSTKDSAFAPSPTESYLQV